MRIVADTNVLVSALLAPAGGPGALLAAIDAVAVNDHGAVVTQPRVAHPDLLGKPVHLRGLSAHLGGSRLPAAPFVIGHRAVYVHVITDDAPAAGDAHPI